MKKWILTLALLALMWVPLGKQGYIWQYKYTHKNKSTTVIGECYYTYIKINGREQWKGKYFQQKPDFFTESHASADFGCLADCVSWVERFTFGGYLI